MSETAAAPSAAPVEASSPSTSTDTTQSTAPVDASQEEALDSALLAEDLTPKQQQTLKKMLKLKVDGQDVEQEIDFNDEEGLRRMLQKGLAGEKRMSEAAQLRKDMEKVVEFLTNDPEGALAKLGHDPQKLAEKIIERKIKEMQMSPEEKEKQELIRELERFKQEKKLNDELRQQQAIEQDQEKYALSVDEQITKALMDHPDLPKSDYSVKRIVNELIKYTKAGQKVEISDVVPIVKSKMDKELRDMIGRMSDEAYEKWIGNDGIDRIRKIRKGKMKAKPVTSASIGDSVSKAAPVEQQATKMSAKDFFKNLK
jgi:hypothetical protein